MTDSTTLHHLALRSLGLAALVATAAIAGTVPLEVRETAGLRRSHEQVTSGVPFPAGTLKHVAQLRLLDEQGQEIPLQASSSATWRDGSVKWALLDFHLDVEAKASRRLALEYGEGISRSVPKAGVQVQGGDTAIEISTGPLRFSVPKTNAAVIQSVRLDAGSSVATERAGPVVDGLELALRLAEPGQSAPWRALPPTEVKVEEDGPERAVVRITGWLSADDAANTRAGMKYLWRLQAFAGSTALHAQLTLINMSASDRLTLVRGYGLRVKPVSDASAKALTARVLFGGDAEAHSAVLKGAGAGCDLQQLTEEQYSLHGCGSATNGIRAPGWLAWSRGTSGVLIAVRDFWQQFPKALRADDGGPVIEFFPAEAREPFDWDQGLAKTHELLLDFDARNIPAAAAADRAAVFEHPLFAVASSRWYCDSKVFGDLAPFDFDLFPDYETLVEAGGDKFIQSMATGIRNWGDFYYGGPYKGKNSFMDLEYDVPHNFLAQFARTGERKYFDAARRMARHQADIDVNHFTGWQWKHSPRHTEIQAEFGHTFTRGLLEHYFLTGDRRSLEAAVELGDYFAKEFQKPGALGNERQIGWGLISLLPVYEATWDPRYLHAVTNTLDRLIRGLDAKGHFDIRWDNRIAFLTGIAATGFIYVHRATGDERVADAALRIIRRTKGYYPEYMGRTLEALAWAYQRTQDPEYLDLLKLTYETSQARALAWRTMDLGAATIFTVHALPWLEQCGLAQRPADGALHLTSEQFASENGLYAHHLPHSEGEFLFHHPNTQPLKLLLIRKGSWKGPGEATLLDASGAVVAKAVFPAEAVVLQRQVFTLTNVQPGSYRLKLQSPPVPSEHGSWITWDVVTEQPTPTVLTTPRFEGLQYVTPRLFTVSTADASTIELVLVGEGEGFKKAVLRDPSGREVATLARFVDLGDKARYEYKLSAPVPQSQRGGLWSLTLQDVALKEAKGLSPYFATTPQSFFPTRK
jgi:hypothetical protein